MTGGTTQWPDIGSIREGAADEAAHRCDRVCWESSKTTDTDWSAQESTKNSVFQSSHQELSGTTENQQKPQGTTRNDKKLSESTKIKQKSEETTRHHITPGVLGLLSGPIGCYVELGEELHYLRVD